LKLTYFPHTNTGSKPRLGETPASQPTKHRINEQISSKEVRVLDENGQLIGIMTSSKALQMAEEKEMDLVEIAPQANPPVVKIIDYGKFVYEIQKKEKIQKKNQQQQQMKEIRFKWRTATHDFNFKTRHAREFILDGNKVKASVMFRGREITHQEVGQELLERFVAALADVAKVDQQIRSEGRTISVVMAPDKAKKKADKDED
jgi:translation initiation factor IF-3